MCIKSNRSFYDHYEVHSDHNCVFIVLVCIFVHSYLSLL